MKTLIAIGLSAWLWKHYPAFHGLIVAYWTFIIVFAIFIIGFTFYALWSKRQGYY